MYVRKALREAIERSLETCEEQRAKRSADLAGKIQSIGFRGKPGTTVASSGGGGS